MTKLGSAAMEFSRGEEGIAPQMIRALSNPGRSANAVSRYWNAYSEEVDRMRRSSIGEVVAYKEIRQIGSGGFGNCFLLERKTDKALRVCKVQAREFFYDGEYEDTPLEVSILRDILPQHDRILRLHEFVNQHHTVQLYYDYYEGGDLAGLICSYSEQWQKLPETFLWHAYLQLSEALAFLHHGYDRRQLGSPPADWTSVIHGDIKDKNIFLGPPDPFSNDPLARVYPSLVLGDFGMADLQPTRRWGTPQWQPPELPVTSMKADVWGVGAVIHALAHEGRPPISSRPPRAENLSWEEWCEDPRSRDPIPLEGWYSNELHVCVFNALEFDPRKRFNSLQLYANVMAVWSVSMAPYCEAIPPLIPALEEKWFDENGVTIKMEDRVKEVEDKADVLLNAAQSLTRNDCANESVKQIGWYSPEELRILYEQYSIPPPPPDMPMEDVQPSPPSPFTINEEGTHCDDGIDFEDGFDDVGLQDFASLIYDEPTDCPTERYGNRLDEPNPSGAFVRSDLATLPWYDNSPDKTDPSSAFVSSDLEMLPKVFVVDAAEELDDFGTINPEQHKGNAPRWWVAPEWETL